QRGRGLIFLRAFLDADLDQRSDALELNRRDDGPHVDRLVKRGANAKRFHPPHEALAKSFGDAFLQQQARTGTADLALVEPDGVDHALDGAVDVGVVEHDEGRLAAELERQRFARTGRRLAYLPADFSRSRERDLVD